MIDKSVSLLEMITLVFSRCVTFLYFQTLNKQSFRYTRLTEIMSSLHVTLLYLERFLPEGSLTALSRYSIFFPSEHGTRAAPSRIAGTAGTIPPPPCLATGEHGGVNSVTKHQIYSEVTVIMNML
jgi:hypothetical protein